MTRPVPSFLLALSFLLTTGLPARAVPLQDPPAAAKEQKAAEQKEKTEAEKQAEEKQQEQTLIDALKKEAATTEQHLRAKNEELKTAGEEQAKATKANKEAADKKVEALTKERDELANTLKGIIANLDEKKQDTTALRKTVFEVLGEKLKEPEKAEQTEELSKQLDAMTRDEVFAKLSVAYSKYKGSVQAVAEAKKELDEIDPKAPEYSKKKQEVDRAEADAAKAAEVLQVHVAAYKAKLGDKAGKDKTLVEIQKYLVKQDGGSFQNLSGEVAVSLVTEWLDSAWTSIKKEAPALAWNLIQFLLILFLFRIIAGICSRIVARALKSKRLRKSDLLADFATRTTKNLIMLIGLVIAARKLNIDTTPLIAGIGAAGLIVGFALQGTLSNFASGIMLLVYRPFDVGSVISVGSVNGKVESMNLVSTTVLTFDNQLVIVPNNNIWGNVITNVTAKKTRRVDLVFGIGYDDDIEHAERILSEIITSHPKVLETPAPNIRVSNLNTSSVDFICRPWVKTADYWEVYWDLTRTVKLRFDQEGISIPFPQQDVHFHHAPTDEEATKVLQPAPRRDAAKAEQETSAAGEKK